MAVGWDAYIWNGDLMPSGGENQYSEEMTAYNNYLVNQSAPDNPIWEEFDRVLNDVKPDAVGITALTPSYPSALRCAQIAQSYAPLVIMGGPHPSATDVVSPFVNHVVKGEGEAQLQLILADKAYYSPQALWPAKGVCIDKYGLLNRDNYGLMMYARGCPYPCEFCGSHKIWTRKVQWRGAADVVDEMEATYRAYDTRYFSFEDDTFTLNYDYTYELLAWMNRKQLNEIPGFRWTCNTRPDRLTPELLLHMRLAGCAAVAVGIESGNDRVLKKMKKKFTRQQVRDAVSMIKDAGLISSGQFMIGYPTETEAEMWDTVRLADELECESVMLSVAAPLPGTALYDEAVQLGMAPIDWATVTTKNTGMLSKVKPEIIREIQDAFDKIQEKTLDAKNESRQWYESQYLPETGPVYGIRE
jgi:radical SAM superfamily enzyme YgiQ (UPF0313 family)